MLNVFGKDYKGRITGTIGDIGVEFENLNKLRGDGGLVSTNNKKLAKK